MFANERYEVILDTLKKQHSVTVSELVSRFGVSIETIRRDLATLEGRDLLTRVHGGAVEVSGKMRVFNSLPERITENRDLKRELSLKAAELISEDDVIAVDAGSTALEFVKVLREKFTKLRVITYSLDIIDCFSDKERFSLVLTGGDFNRDERIFGGFLAEEALKRLHVSKSFIFTSAVSVKHGVTITLSEFYNLEKTLMSISDKSYLLVDSTKFEKASRIKLCEPDEFDAIITDSRLDDGIARLYAEKSIIVIKGEEEED